MHKITGSLHCSHFLLFPFDFSVAVLLFSGQVKTSFHLGKGTKVKVISGKPKWYLAVFYPSLLGLYSLGFIVHCVPCSSRSLCSRAKMEPAPDQGRFDQVRQQALCFKEYATFHSFSCFLSHCSAQCVREYKHTRQLVPSQTHSWLQSASTWNE